MSITRLGACICPELEKDWSMTRLYKRNPIPEPIYTKKKKRVCKLCEDVFYFQHKTKYCAHHRLKMEFSASMHKKIYQRHYMATVWKHRKNNVE